VALATSESLAKYVTLGVVLALFSLTAFIPTAVFATNNDQYNNRQITSTNTSNDLGWWEAFNVRTNTTFSIGTKAFTLQQNALVNKCGVGGSCTWWIQMITGIDAGSLIGRSGGYWVHDAHLEPFVGVNDLGSFCKLTIPKSVNIDQYNFDTIEQVTNGTSGLTFQLWVEDKTNNTVFYSLSQTCSMPTGATPVDYAYQVEGVIAGCGSSNCGTNVSFSPLSHNIFGAFIDLVSNYNVMSSSVKTTQTAEGSNLYQIPSTGGYYSTTYGSKYLYTVVSSEFFYSNGGEVTKTDS